MSAKEKTKIVAGVSCKTLVMAGVMPDWWEEARQYLMAQDEIMRQLIENCPKEGMILRGDAFFTLCRAVVGQQISVKAADSVWERFCTALTVLSDGTSSNTLVTPTPTIVLRCSPDLLRSCGLSQKKAQYILGLAQAFNEKGLSHKALLNMPVEESLATLVRLHGIGVWTAHMCQMFALALPDVWPIGDLGLLKAIERHYAVDVRSNAARANQLGMQFAPYRTAATWFLWRSLDPVPVDY